MPNRKPPNAGIGRPKGRPNKITMEVKKALEEAFERLGGVDSLVKWGRTKAGQQIFYQMWVKMLPRNVELSGKDGGPIYLTTTAPISEHLKPKEAKK